MNEYSCHPDSWHHRVSVEFCSAEKQSLRQDMEMCAQSGTVSERLRREVVALRCGRISESVLETPHRS